MRRDVERTQNAFSRASDRVARARSRALEDLTEAGETLRRARDGLVKRSRALSWTGEPDEAEAVARLVEHVIAEGALDSAILALEDGEPLAIAAHGARIRALAALAALAGKKARARIERHVVAVARAHADMADAAAWALAARLTTGRAHTRFAEAAVTAAGRSNAPGALLAALDVAPEPAAIRMAHMAAARLAHNDAGEKLGVLPRGTPGLRAACAHLTAEGARALVRALTAGAEPPDALTAPFLERARARLLARATALLPEAEARDAAARVLEIVKAFSDGPLPLDGEEVEAVVRHLDRGDLDVARNEMWSSAAIAERLAALGSVDDARALAERAGGSYTAEAALRAAAFAPQLADLARASVASLDAPSRGRLCGEHPAAAVAVLGPAETLRYADESGDDTDSYVRIVALARVAGALPEPQRSEAAARAIAAYREDPDSDALTDLCRCAPWMPVRDAAWLLFATLGRHHTPRSFENTFLGHSGIGPLAPLIARASGDRGLLAAADAIVAADVWS